MTRTSKNYRFRDGGVGQFHQRGIPFNIFQNNKTGKNKKFIMQNSQLKLQCPSLRVELSGYDPLFQPCKGRVLPSERKPQISRHILARLICSQMLNKVAVCALYSTGGLTRTNTYLGIS